MSRLLVDTDVTTKQRTIVHEHATGEMAFETEQDVEDILEVNKELRKEGRDFSGSEQMMHHVAQIPLVIVDDLMRKGIWQDSERLREWLNDPDNRAFRTMRGRI